MKKLIVLCVALVSCGDEVDVEATRQAVNLRLYGFQDVVLYEGGLECLEESPVGYLFTATLRDMKVKGWICCEDKFGPRNCWYHWTEVTP